MEAGFILHEALKIMSPTFDSQRRNWFGVVLRDEHFWIPFVVLIAGLIVLRWIA
jgi:hypothetical protein